MIISVTSGKGGTGKTLIATSLALSIKDNCKVQLLDCDVEEPNAHIFIKSEIKNKEPWEPPPSYQQGLWMYQYTFYKQIHHLFGLRTILIVKGKNGEWLAQFMDNLKPNNYRKLKDGKNYAFFNLNQFEPYAKFIEGL